MIERIENIIRKFEPIVGRWEVIQDPYRKEIIVRAENPNIRGFMTRLVENAPKDWTISFELLVKK